MTCAEIIKWLLYGRPKGYVPLLNTGPYLPNYTPKELHTPASFNFQRTAKMKHYIPSKSEVDNSLQDSLAKDKQLWQEDIAYMEMLKNSKKRDAQNKSLHFKKHSNTSIMVAVALVFLFLTVATIIFHLKNKNNEKLYIQFYSPLHTNLAIPITSNLSVPILDEAFREYSNKNYSHALKLFNRIRTNSDLYCTAQFYAGICDMELNQMEAALIHFDNVNQFPFLKHHVSWYKGLCNLQQGSLNEAIQIFTELKKSNSSYTTIVEKILNQLRK